MSARTLGALAAAVLIACGCATKGAQQLRIDPERNGRKMEIFWPAAPEVPRYFFAGELIGETNYVDESAATRSKTQQVLRWIAGLGEQDEAPLGLVRPQTGLVDAEGRILVTDASRQAVVVFDPTRGVELWERASGLTHFVTPVGIAAADGRTWVADADLGYVVELDHEGRPVAMLGKGELVRPTGLAFDPVARRLYVADSHAHAVKVFATDGKLVSTIGHRGEGEGELNFPTHIVFAAQRLYVADSMNGRVQVFSTATGAHTLTIGAPGLYVGNLVRPKGVAVDSQGNIYVVESYYDHLLVYDKLGTFLLAIGGLGKDIGQFYLPAGVWTDARNRVFVADMFNGRVVVLQFLGGDHD